MADQIVRTSKFLSLVLRHRPEKIGLTLDAQGWADVSELIACARRNGVSLSEPLLRAVVEQNDKQRYALSEDGRRIRAVQGHSVTVDLGLTPQQPPETLYHGTVPRFLDSIRQDGLVAGRRTHVHLSPDEATAITVGQRRGNPVVLRVRAGEMWRAGLPFYRAENGVWLVARVPPEYLQFP